MTDTLVSATESLQAPRPIPLPDIPFTRFRLANGLTLIVHEDRSAPLIAVELRYNVGSKDEPPGRFGFAHLFEHLMFHQSANRRGNWHVALAELGGSNVNGTTSYDRTNYYQTVPTGAIDTLLWMESDRMGHLLEGLTATAFSAEVEVVKNEKLQRESAPEGLIDETVAGTLYPVGHPYNHTIIGTFADLDGATLDTAQDWYRRWYGAGNAVLSLAGDISPEDALAKVEHWFGDLPQGPAIRRATRWLPPRQGPQRLRVEEQVATAGLARIWSVPAHGDQDAVDLNFIASALTGTPRAALIRRLIDEENLCSAVRASIDNRFLCSEFCISATFLPGADGARIEAIIDAEVERLLLTGPRESEIAEALRANRMGFIRDTQSLGQRAGLFAADEISFGVPDEYRRLDATAAAASPARVAAAGRRWLGPDSLTIEIRPFIKDGVARPAPDRTHAPVPGVTAAPRFPQVERGTLSNGVAVRLARRPGSAMVSTLLMIEGGTAGDPVGAEGLTAFTVGQLASGTRLHDRHALAERQRHLNSNISAGSDPETVGVECKGLLDTFPEAVRLMAEITSSPTFPQEEYARAHARAVNSFEHQRRTAGQAAMRASAVLTYGKEHMLGGRATGTSDSIARLTRTAMIERHNALFQPATAALFVVGDLTIDQAIDHLEAAFGSWQTTGKAAPQSEGILTPTPGRFLIGRNDAPQSVIRASLASQALSRPHQIGPALGVFGHIFGESFGSRLNRSLREERGWTYGARSMFERWRGIGSFVIDTTVQADRTIDALKQIEAELRGLVTDNPITAVELERARAALMLEAPGYWTDENRILAALVDSFRHDLADDHHDLMCDRLRTVSIDDVEAVAAIVADIAAMSVVVAGNPQSFDAADLIAITDDGDPDHAIGIQGLDTASRATPAAQRPDFAAMT